MNNTLRYFTEGGRLVHHHTDAHNERASLHTDGYAFDQDKARPVSSLISKSRETPRTYNMAGAEP